MKSQNEEILDEAIEHIVEEYETHYRDLGELIVTAFEPYKNIIDRIQKRLKDIDSIKRKMERKGIGLEQIRYQIRDIIGIRIIIHFLSDIPVVTRELCALTELNISAEQDIENYIATPQATGYRSLHINALYRKVVPCEIQIRTSFQDGWATKSHLLAYKLEDIPPRWQRHFRLLSDQLHLADFVLISIWK